MKKIIALLIISIGLGWINIYCLAGETLELDLLIEEALNNNPHILMAKNDWRALMEKIPQARALDDPMLSYGYFGEGIQTRVGPQRQKVGISQKVPFMGKLSLKGEVARKQAQIAGERHELIKREIIKNLKKAYYDHYFIANALVIAEEEKLILENLEIVSRRKYESGEVSQQDVLKAQVEITKLLDELLILRQRQGTIKAMINTLLNRQIDSEIDRPSDFEIEELNYELGELQVSAKEIRQELLMARLAIERDEDLKGLARLNYLPDFTFGIDYIEIESGSTTRPDDGQDAWMGSVKMNLPIWQNKLGAGVKETRFKLESSESMYQNIENQIEFEIEDLYFRLHTTYKTMDLYKNSLIPQAEQAFSIARSGYESGNVDFLNWLESERTLLKTRLKFIKEKADYQKLLADLERAVGRDL